MKRQFTKVNGKQGRYSDYEIPEPTLWSIFSNLVDACLLLQYGGVVEDDVVEGWTPIVHRDLHHGNVLLDDPLPEAPFPSYPRAVLTDFGLAIRTNTDDPLNPMAYNDCVGLDYWRAPEQNTFLTENTIRPFFHDSMSGTDFSDAKLSGGLAKLLLGDSLTVSVNKLTLTTRII